MNQNTKVKLCCCQKMPVIALGVWQSGKDTKQAVLDALKAGYRHIDTAACYGNEEAVGEAVKESGIPREDIFITTKLWNDDIRAGNTRKALLTSLQKLQMDYVDLYLIHWPVEGYIDAYLEMEKLKEAYEAIIEMFHDCTNDSWSSEMNYDPDVYYDYEEDYIADFYNNYGQMDANISNTNESDWFCNSSVTTGTGNETQATLSGTAYNSCSGNVSSGVSYTSINYTYCDTTSCGNTKPESVQQISNARYKKHTSTVDATYVPSTLFYNVYPSGEITDTPADDNVALENSLPVSLSTKRGIYEYSIKLDNLGEYYDSGNTGRLIGGSNAVINRQDYAEFFDENGEVQYVCAYLVNMGKEEDYTIVCDWDQCQDGDCTVNCVGPGCDDVCDGNDCIASCIGAGCIYDVDAGSSLIERVVSLSNLFPNGTDSYNWNRDLNEKAEVTIDEIEEVGNSIYDEEPILSVTLTPGATRAIRAYNDEAERYNRGGYSNSTLSCYALDGYEEIACYSSFITNLINGNVSYGDETYATGLDIIGDRSLIMGNNYRTVSDDNFRYFTIWNSGISEDDMIGPSWK